MRESSEAIFIAMTRNEFGLEASELPTKEFFAIEVAQVKISADSRVVRTRKNTK